MALGTKEATRMVEKLLIDRDTEYINNHMEIMRASFLDDKEEIYI